MKVPCQGSLGWFRVISFIWLVTIGNAPQLQHLSVPPVCIGRVLYLLWENDLSWATAGTITWTFDQSEQNSSVPIIIATFDVADGTFQIDPDATPRYKGRLSQIMTNEGYTAGIKLSNVDEKDVGSYGVIIRIDKPKHALKRDDVNVSLFDVKSNEIVLDGKPIICTIESKSTQLSWKVVNPNLPEDVVCKNPTWTEWRRNGKVIARRKSIDGPVLVDQEVNRQSRLQSRLRDVYVFPLAIVIEPTLVTDAGNYTVTARYGNLLNMSSDEIVLQVQRPMNISKVEDIRRCIGTDVVFNWTFDPGTNCNNHTHIVNYIRWEKELPPSRQTIWFETTQNPSKPDDGSRLDRNNTSNAGLIIRRLLDSDTGTYYVTVMFLNGLNLTDTTVLTVETPLTPKSISGLESVVEMCEGESFILSWSFVYPDRNNSCTSYATVISRSWYLEDILVFSQTALNTTKIPSLTTRKVTPTQEKVTATDITPNTKATIPEVTKPKDTTPETITRKEEPTQKKITTADITPQIATTGESMIPKDRTAESEPMTTGANQVPSGRRGRRFVFDQPNSATISYDQNSNADIIPQMATTGETTIPKDTTPETITRKEEPTKKKITTADITPQIATTGESTISKDASPEATPLPMEPMTTGANQATKDTTPETITRKEEPTQPNSSTFSYDRSSDANLAVYRVKLENSGNYHVKVSFTSSTDNPPIDIYSNVHTKLVVKKAPAVSLQDTDDAIRPLQRCTDQLLPLKWNLDKYDCKRPFIISWHFRKANQTEEKIGSIPNGRPNFTERFDKRVSVTNRVSLTMQSLTTNDSGIYTVRLTYPSDKKSVAGSERTDLKGAIFSESSINVHIEDSSTDDCTGLKIATTPVNFTRNGEDVRITTNRTVSVNDTVTLFVNISDIKGMKQAQFFWKETHHKLLKQFIGKKFYEPGIWSIQWKVSKRLPGILFRPKEFRREVQLGVRVIYMQDKFTIIMTSFYFRNHKDISDTSKSMSKVKSGRRGKKGNSAKQCDLNTQAVLATAMFWVLVLHQQLP